MKKKSEIAVADAFDRIIKKSNEDKNTQLSQLVAYRKKRFEFKNEDLQRITDHNNITPYHTENTKKSYS